MQERALRQVLLIQAIEETDRIGEALPLAERTEATRAVAGNNMSAVETQPEAQLSSATEWFLLRRAELLLRSLRERSPGIDYVLTVAGGATSLDRGMLILSFAVGVLLSFLDGNRGINIFALPLVMLIAWNLLVYVSMLRRWRKKSSDAAPATAPGVASSSAGASKATSDPSKVVSVADSAGSRPPRLSLFAGFYSRWARSRIDKLLGHSTHFNAPLAPGLRRFAGDWWEVARPLFAMKARRLLHLSAVVVALGLIVGYYLRGFILRSAAGWEGGDLIGPGSARTLLTVLYGPASLLSGIPIPAADEIERLRLTAASGGGGDAAPWIHLIAWTAGLYIVLPRVLAALSTSFSLWRLSRRLVLPPGAVGYVRTLFAAEKVQPGNGEPHDL
ncbi:MAG: hypothetical protein JWL65_5148 [Gammaproteobacteria bacterium]|nr:hypothetical protein [Gammaproteobacteria bacterium]